MLHAVCFRPKADIVERMVAAEWKRNELAINGWLLAFYGVMSQLEIKCWQELE